MAELTIANHCCHIKVLKAQFITAGLAAFDLPLPFIKADKFNQPIFGCNNLSGKTADPQFLSFTQYKMLTEV